MLEELISQSWTQWVALVTGIIYVILAARENVLCWVFGIISCACIAWDDFFSFRLFADGVLQVIYIGLGLFGLYKWMAGRDKESTVKVHSQSLKTHLIAISFALLITWPISIWLNELTEASYGFVDTLTTILSLYATWLLVEKVIENWLYWILIDVVYIYLFYNSGGKLIALLYLIFCVVACYGYYSWRRSKRDKELIETLSK